MMVIIGHDSPLLESSLSLTVSFSLMALMIITVSLEGRIFEVSLSGDAVVDSFF